MREDRRQWWDLIPQLPKWILSAVTFVVAVVGFIQLLQRDFALVASVLLALAGTGAWVALAYLVFKRSPTEVGNGGRRGGPWRIMGFAGLALIPLLVLGGLLYRCSPARRGPIAEATKAIEHDPKDAGAWVTRGDAYADEHRYGKAIEDFHMALSLGRSESENAGVYKRLGNAYLGKKEPDRAIEEYNRSIKFEPTKDSSVYVQRGIAYAGKGQHDLAIEDYNTALGLEGEDAWALKQLGIAYTDKQQYDRAIETLKASIDIDERRPPTDETTYVALGNAYAGQNDYGRAIGEYKSALRVDRRTASAYKGLGEAYEELGNRAEAIKNLRLFLKFNRDDPQSRAKVQVHLRELERQNRD